MVVLRLPDTCMNINSLNRAHCNELCKCLAGKMYMISFANYADTLRLLSYTLIYSLKFIA